MEAVETGPNEISAIKVEPVATASAGAGDSSQQGAALLRSGGAMVIMDSPAVDKERISSWTGGHQLEKKQLIEILDKADLGYKYEQVQRSIRWHLQQIRMRLAGSRVFDLPFIVVESG